MGACAGEPRASAPDLGPDGGRTDGPGPRTDSGPRDLGTADAGAPDEGLADAGLADAGSDGALDMGPADGGEIDAGPCIAPPGAACDPVRRTGCPDGEACIVVDATGSVECRATFGERGIGTSCRAGAECVPGGVCVVPSGGGILQCRQLCETTVHETCTRIRDFPECLGVFFPSTISGGTYFGP